MLSLLSKFKKAVFFLVLLLACVGGKAIAQKGYYIEDERTFYGGFVAGANFLQVDGDYFAGYHKVGFNMGGIVYTKLDEHLAASLEILYAQKGARSTDPQQIASGQYITNYGIDLKYAEIPLMINYFDKRKSHFGGGFSYSRLASSSEYITTYPAQNFDLNKYPFKKSDYNLVLSGNLHCYKGFFLNIRFQYSLVSIRDNIPQDYSKASQFNNMWVVRVMYLFM